LATTESFYKQASLDLEPTLPGELRGRFAQFCLRLKEAIEDCADNARGAVLASFREDVHRCAGVSGDEKIDLMFAESLVLDLVAQDWRIDAEGGRVRIVAPSEEDAHRADKDRIRRGHLLGRDAQLREPSVAEFVRGMERRRLTSKGWHSIFSLMRDGADLAEQLKRVNEISDEKVRDKELAQTVAPYIQCFDREDVCEYTGLKLGDIWRYFRHTWVSEYRSIPGRSMMVLVRDAAVPNHPVIGIAALGSSVVQHGLRDKWIGWHPETFLKQVTEHPTAKVAKWLLKSLEDLTEAIHADDLRAEGLLTNNDFENPSEAVIAHLLKESEKDIREHRTKPQREVLKVAETDGTDDSSWERAALTYLFRSKRCKQLATLLSARKTFMRYGLTSANRKGLKAALKSPKGRAAIAQVLRMVKAEHAGVDMMDITVCGAIAPYNHLIGGKLVCMLLCSPEVTQYYRKRYSEQISVIASSMKGRRVIRKPNLVLLCTTSLYGVGSSQYNRVKVPAEAVGGLPGDEIAYEKLGYSWGYGTYHFSRETISLANTLVGRRQDGRVVNSIFGEGVNPLMRKMREALEEIGLKSDSALLHGNGRVTYGIVLARNFKQVLLGFDKRPSYILPQTEVRLRTGLIAAHWRRRWLSPRARRPEVLDRVANHTLTYPVRHGAVVPLEPDAEDPRVMKITWD
jgi:hypothetical protein